MPRNIFNNLAANYEVGESSQSAARNVQNNSIDLEISISAAGLHLEMTANGDIMSSMLINQGIPARHLNSFLSGAIMPIVAAYGPWKTGYGFKFEKLELKMQIREEDGVLLVSQATQTVTALDNHHPHSAVLDAPSTLRITELSDNATLLSAQPANSSSDLQLASPELNHTAPMTALLTDAQEISSMPMAAAIEEVQEVQIIADSQQDLSMHVPLQPIIPSVPDVAASSNRKGKATAPESTITLRRSARSNKYDGFKVPPLSDTKLKTSKVKPRVIPSATSANIDSALSEAPEIPPPTAIPVIQHIGTVMCGIPAEELTDEHLQASSDDGPPSANS